PAILEEMNSHYLVLEINSNRIFQYTTTYFDDNQFNLYYAHHNGRLNRYKIRHRTYLDSGKSFLEMKFKSNKSRTIKKRDACTTEDLKNGTFVRFLNKHTPYDPAEFHESLTNHFSRITFVNKEFSERLTFDIGLAFSNTGKNIELPDFGIAEIKNERKWTSSHFSRFVKQFGLRKSGFSKYAFGCTMLFPDLKTNRFKKTHLQINKLHHDITTIS
ncbi:MAG: polyphosphate polymerase domain-containing protein, partial [Bacteroidetes bacterium]|nr:polyphosphate polymerase domain-containing protein [Bacteroidota bacterium]